jgi:putative ABC transport system permease protein
LDTLLQDIRYAARSLWRARAVTVTAVVCLAVGIGTNTAVFSVVHGILFRALPFTDADRIVSVLGTNPERGFTDGGLTWADLAELRATGAFAQVEALSGRNFTLTGGEEPERVQGSAVTPGLFAMLGVQPRIGRQFKAEEAGPAGFEQAVLLSDGLWRRRFGADEAIVGRPVHINGRELIVAGVMPPRFRFPETDELWVPLGSRDATDRAARYLFTVARLARDVDMSTAHTRAASLATRLRTEHPRSHAGWSFSVRPFRDTFVDAPAQRLLFMTLGAVAFVLLIACANVANLLLARAADRSREVSVRAALGASRGRVVRLLLTESVVLALASGALGVLLAIWWVDAVLRVIPEELAYWIRITVDAPVLIYTLIIALTTGVLFGTLPALQASRVDLHSALKEGSRSAGAGRGRMRLRAVLVTGEVALSVVLLVGAALMIQSFLRLQQADPGFDPARILSLRINASGDQYDSVPARAALYERAIAELTALPGVAGAAATISIPADDGGPSIPLRAAGDDRAADRALVVTTLSSTASFFAVLGVPLTAGRAFTTAEAMDTAARVAIVGRALAQRLWPGQQAIGRRILLGDSAREALTVVGVVPDLQYEEFGEEDERARLQVHLPYARRPYRQMALLVRAHTDPATLKQDVRSALQRADPTLATFDVLTMNERRRYTTWPQRLFGQMFGNFGAIAVLLALVGVYGVMAYTVAQRRREIGIRLALGARPADVLRDVIGRALRLAALGALIGTAAALAVVQLLSGLLYGVSLTDPLTFVLVPTLLLTAALLAGAVPARRAARIDPLEALRAE